MTKEVLAHVEFATSNKAANGKLVVGDALGRCHDLCFEMTLAAALLVTSLLATDIGELVAYACRKVLVLVEVVVPLEARVELAGEVLHEAILVCGLFACTIGVVEVGCATCLCISNLEVEVVEVAVTCEAEVGAWG